MCRILNRIMFMIFTERNEKQWGDKKTVIFCKQQQSKERGRGGKVKSIKKIVSVP